MEEAVNLSTLLLAHPAADDDGLIFTEVDQITASEAKELTRRRTGQLTALGMRAGQAVACRATSGIETVITMMATWSAGAVYVPVNPRAPEAEVRRIEDRMGPAAIFDDTGLHPLPGSEVLAEDVAFVTWTSGTSGPPKPILHTHAGYLEIIDRVLGPLRGEGRSSRPPSPNLVPVSLALNAGIYNTLFGLRAGAPIVLMNRFEPLAFARLVERFAIRSTVLPPAAISELGRDERISSLAPLRYVRSITAPLSPPEARRFSERFGAFVLNGYGQAEIGEVIGWTAADAKDHPDKLGAVGRPHPGVSVRIGAAGDDGVGHLLVRPPGMALGYAGGDELADRIDADGFLDTGDLARVDDDGFVWIEGRVGDVINRGGNKVYPDEVEAVLRTVPGVTDAAVVGVPDARLGELPVAVVTSSREVSDADLEQACREQLVPYKVPAAFFRNGSLPRSEVGKLLRGQLRDHVVSETRHLGED